MNFTERKEKLEEVFGLEYLSWSESLLEAKLIDRVLGLEVAVKNLVTENLSLGCGGLGTRTIWGQPILTDPMILTTNVLPSLQSRHLEEMAELAKDSNTEVLIVGGRNMGKRHMMAVVSNLMCTTLSGKRFDEPTVITLLPKLDFEPSNTLLNTKIEANPARQGMKSRKQKNRPDPRNNRKK